MSGIAGIVNLDGAPLDRRALAQLTQSLIFRGPDAHRIWVDGAAGFGFTLLKTTNDSKEEQQPFTLDGKVWVVADARIDARHEFLGELRAQGCNVDSEVPDVELIAQAYSIWNEGCVDHLLGDFAFGIWDAPRKRVFCARDHMGVKPLYYAHLGSSVVFSNTLDCIRQYHTVSDRLNDLAIADFLLFGWNCDLAKTTFADIHRVPPAHTATWSENGLQLRRYWTLPIDEPLRYRRDDDYVDRFKELLRTAVEDRLRTDRIGVLMSGGLDSPALAAATCQSLRNRTGDPAVRAFTNGNQSDDEEFYYAGLVAKSLGISCEFRKWDPGSVDPEWYKMPFHTPEPIRYPTSLMSERAHFQLIASHSRVVFYGEGPDNALRLEWAPYFSYLARRKRFGRILYDLYFQMTLHRRIPFPTIPWLAGSHREENGPLFPNWFNPAFKKRLQLNSRWEQLKMPPMSSHPVRPAGHGSFGTSLWQVVFEAFDAAQTKSPLEVRHPFLDVRMLRFLLAVPALPWCRHKYLIRRSMRGQLPDPVLKRPKSPLINDPWEKRVLELGLPPVNMTSVLERYVDKNRLQDAPATSSQHFWINFRVRSLAFWLQNMHQVKEIPLIVETPAIR